MQIADLLREFKAQELLVEKMRLGVKLKKEKDTARYRREKRQLARMKTELTRKAHEQLRATSKVSTVPAHT
jgi:hypothetical protein